MSDFQFVCNEKNVIDITQTNFDSLIGQFRFKSISSLSPVASQCGLVLSAPTLNERDGIQYEQPFSNVKRGESTALPSFLISILIVSQRITSDISDQITCCDKLEITRDVCQFSIFKMLLKNCFMSKKLLFKVKLRMFYHVLDSMFISFCQMTF